jgi:hypothetical protein
VIVRSRVHSLDDVVDSVENMATTYEPVKIRKKYLRILILSSLDNLINSFAVFLMISYNAKKKMEIRLCWKFACVGNSLVNYVISYIR